MKIPDDYTQYIEPALDFLNAQLKALIEHAITKVAAQAWQDGHDTALTHGQSKNPYEGDPQ